MPILPRLLRHAVRASLPGAAARRARDGRAAPTASLYFTDPLRGLIAPTGRQEARPVRKLTATLYASDAAAVVIRYAGPEELALIRNGGYRKVVLVADDDFHAAGPGDGLPLAYRRRLIAYRDGALQALLPFVTHVAAPSDAILAHYPGKAGLRIDPVQCHGNAPLDHHRAAGGITMIYAGTQSHAGDIGVIAPVLARFLRETPGAHLTTFLHGHVPKPLRRLPNARHLAVMPWPSYRQFVAANRFHIGLAPALDTGFNRARSVSKLHDHAGFGAAGLYAALPPFAGVIEPGVSGLLLPMVPEAWLGTLRELAEARSKVAAIAAAAQKLSQAVGRPDRLRNFWLKTLDIDSSFTT